MEENMTITEATNELSVHSNTLRRWIKEYEEYGESAFPGHGNALLNINYEMKKIIKENEELKLENELLKKYRAFLKRKSV